MKRDWIVYLCVILFCANSCATPGKSYEKALAKAPFDVIIVPGIPYQGDD